MMVSIYSTSGNKLYLHNRRLSSIHFSNLNEQVLLFLGLVVHERSTLSYHFVLL